MSGSLSGSETVRDCITTTPFSTRMSIDTAKTASPTSLRWQWLLSERNKVLMLGTAGGALATQISRRGGQITAVDDWDGAFAIARQWFGLPAEVECIHADAMAFLKSTARQLRTPWRSMSFRGLEIPIAMLNEDIAALLASVLAPGGMIVWNVADEPLAWTTQRIAKALRRGGLDPRMVAVLDGDVGNTLVVCDGIGASPTDAEVTGRRSVTTRAGRRLCGFKASAMVPTRTGCTAWAAPPHMVRSGSYGVRLRPGLGAGLGCQAR